MNDDKNSLAKNSKISLLAGGGNFPANNSAAIEALKRAATKSYEVLNPVFPEEKSNDLNLTVHN